MPCRDDGWPPAPSMEPKLTRMLCSALLQLEAGDIPIPLDCKAWWAAHKKEDALRKRAEANKLAEAKKRKAILSKLTSEEREILGLRDE